MAVYVDKAQNPYGRMKMCHMLADSLEELHAMAYRIGIQRRWFQSGASVPHYDICQAKRSMAIANGAVVVSRRELVSIIRRLRAGNPIQEDQPSTPRCTKTEDMFG